MSSGKSRKAASEIGTYCSRHGHYFKAGEGCPICRHESSPAGSQEMPRLQKCPACGEMTLVWFRCRNSCECLNVNCRLQQVEAGY